MAGSDRKKMLDALEELKGQGFLMSYEVRETKEGRKIIDVKDTVTASHDFRTEQKAANAAAKNRQLGLVDK
jgi:hypothetical protein